MILEYRDVVLWDTATGRRIPEALDGQLAPPPVAAAWLGGQDGVDPLDLQLGLALLAAMLLDEGELADRVERAAAAVGEIVAVELSL